MGGYRHTQNTSINTKGCSRCKHTTSICHKRCSVTPRLICLIRLVTIACDIAICPTGCGTIASLCTYSGWYSIFAIYPTYPNQLLHNRGHAGQCNTRMEFHECECTHSRPGNRIGDWDRKNWGEGNKCHNSYTKQKRLRAKYKYEQS